MQASEKHIVFTSVNFNYLGRALTLARSVKKYDQSVHFVLFLVEPDFELSKSAREILLNCDEGNSFDEVMALEDLDLIYDSKFWNYSVVEMCTAVKGQITVQLLAHETTQFVTYLDPDLFFYGALSDIREMHAEGDVLLTPHLNHVPYSTQIITNDEIDGILRHGIFNLGFVSFKNTKNGRKIAAWWADRLQISSKADFFNGLFTDQKWWDLSQIYFKDTFAVKNDGWNMAPWNVSERRLVSLNPPYLENGDLLLFYHFSKFPSSEFDIKIQFSTNSIFLDNLIKEYREEFLNSQIYIEKIIPRINAHMQVPVGGTRFIPKQNPKIEIFLTNILILFSGNALLRKIALYNYFSKSVAKFVYEFFLRTIYRIEMTAPGRKTTPKIKDIRLDLLLITHKGGGGVSEVVSGRIHEIKGQSKLAGVLKTIPGGDLVLNINNMDIPISSREEISQIIDQSTEIEIHHILGLEDYLKVFLRRKINRFFLHDKYLISEMPFSDARRYLKSNDTVPGINSPLNKSSRNHPDDWQFLTRKLLQNSIKVFAPSDYLIQEYNLSFPEIEIEKFLIEPSFKPETAIPTQNKNRPLFIISPTGIHKGSSVLTNVARTIELSNPSVVFRVFGNLDIVTETELKNLRNVVLAGQISRSRLNHALSGYSDAIGWIPSLTGEAYSLALSDFMSNGLTVIATNLGAVAERLHKVPGNFLYDPAIPLDVLTRLLIALSENKSLEDFLPYLELT